MKNILLIPILLISINIYSQEKSNDYKKMIDSAITIKATQLLKHYNLELTKSNNTTNWKHYINNYKEQIENIFIIDENHNPYMFLSSKELVGIKFKQLNIYDSKNKKRLKKGIDAWKIVCNLENNKMKIYIIDFTITYSNKIYEFSNGGGITFIFEYSCEEKKWVIISTKNNTL